MEYKNILIDRDISVVTITLNRPQVLNATNLELWHELHKAVLGLKENNEVKVVVLRGAGDRAFSWHGYKV